MPSGLYQDFHHACLMYCSLNIVCPDNIWHFSCLVFSELPGSVVLYPRLILEKLLSIIAQDRCSALLLIFSTLISFYNHHNSLVSFLSHLLYYCLYFVIFQCNMFQSAQENLRIIYIPAMESLIISSLQFLKLSFLYFPSLFACHQLYVIKLILLVIGLHTQTGNYTIVTISEADLNVHSIPLICLLCLFVCLVLLIDG